MAIDLKKLMSTKTDEGLQVYLDNRIKYTTDAVESAVAEMQKRGRKFSDEELARLRSELRAQEEAREKREEEVFGNRWEENVVEDINAPAYYSERAINLFSILFSVLFGAVLLSINLQSTENRKGIWEVIVFGFVYTSLQIWLLSLIPGNGGLMVVLSLIGAFLMNHFFWKKHIGRKTKYRSKPIWTPLFIGLSIFIPLIFLIFSRLK